MSKDPPAPSSDPPRRPSPSADAGSDSAAQEPAAARHLDDPFPTLDPDAESEEARRHAFDEDDPLAALEDDEEDDPEALEALQPLHTDEAPPRRPTDEILFEMSDEAPFEMSEDDEPEDPEAGLDAPATHPRRATAPSPRPDAPPADARPAEPAPPETAGVDTPRPLPMPGAGRRRPDAIRHDTDEGPSVDDLHDQETVPRTSGRIRALPTPGVAPSGSRPRPVHRAAPAAAFDDARHPVPTDGDGIWLGALAVGLALTTWIGTTYGLAATGTAPTPPPAPTPVHVAAQNPADAPTLTPLPGPDAVETPPATPSPTPDAEHASVPDEAPAPAEASDPEPVPPTPPEDVPATPGDAPPAVASAPEHPEPAEPKIDAPPPPVRRAPPRRTTPSHPPAAAPAPARRPPPAPAREGPRTLADLQQTLAGSYSLMRCTHRAEAAGTPVPPGAVWGRVTVLPDGKATAFTLDAPTWQGTPLAECLAYAVAGLDFPPGDEAQTIRFPAPR